MDEVRAPNYELAENDYMSGMKYKEIAEKYNVTINTVKTWKQRYDWSKNKKKSVHTKSEKVCTQKTDDISWLEIEKEYVTDIRKSPCSLEDLADKYSIPIQTIKDMSAKKHMVIEEI